VKAAVVGSLNMDLVLAVPELPARGQTVLSRSLDRSPGGKGANQAVALRRLGAEVEMVGAVGADGDGTALRRVLESAGVSTRFVAERQEQPTGLAVVCVGPDGDNLIVVAPGANASLSPGDVARRAAALDHADLLLLQLEVPLETVAAAARLGADRGALVVLNAAPVPGSQVPPDLLGGVGALVVNEGEAAALGGGGDPKQAAARLLALGPRAVVVTLGGAGCVVGDEHGVTALPAHRVPVVDTTGAGDSFAAAFGFGLAEGRPAAAAAALASAAAALTVTRPGAQSTPTAAEVAAFRRGTRPAGRGM
jgi:ribokinase